MLASSPPLPSQHKQSKREILCLDPWEFLYLSCLLYMLRSVVVVDEQALTELRGRGPLWLCPLIGEPGASSQEMQPGPTSVHLWPGPQGSAWASLVRHGTERQVRGRGN